MSATKVVISIWCPNFRLMGSLGLDISPRNFASLAVLIAHMPQLLHQPLWHPDKGQWQGNDEFQAEILRVHRSLKWYAATLAENNADREAVKIVEEEFSSLVDMLESRKAHRRERQKLQKFQKRSLLEPECTNKLTLHLRPC